MRLGFDRADFDKLAGLWNEFYPEKFRIDSELLRLNTIDSHLFDWGASIIESDEDGPVAFVAVKKSAASLYRGPDPDQAHITGLAYRSAPAMVDLLSYTKKLLANRGVFKLYFGQDTRHFFPGCPVDSPSLRDFLIVEGFEEDGDQMDLELDLREYAVPRSSLAQLGGYPGCPAPQSDLPYVRAIEENDREALRAFLEREFPGRWRYDVFAKIASEERSDFVYGLWIDGRIEGFAMTQDFTHRLPIGGGAWRLSLGLRWGSLGPIGVSKALRGKGLGNALLAAGLSGLKLRGVENCVIDWTTLETFYEKHGFQPTRRYTSFALNLIS